MNSPRRLASVAIIVGVLVLNEIESTGADGLVTSNVQPSTIAEYVSARAERVGRHVHRPEGVGRVVVLGGPCWVSGDRDGVVLRLVDNVHLVRLTEEDLLRAVGGQQSESAMVRARRATGSVETDDPALELAKVAELVQGQSWISVVLQHTTDTLWRTEADLPSNR